MTELITSASNALPKRIRSLADKKNRVREQAFVVEGMQPVWRAAESGWAVDVLALSPTVMQEKVVSEMADRLAKGGTRVVTMSGDIFNRLSERDGPSGVMAIVRSETTPLRHVKPGKDDVWIVLHRVHNPGNLGTILRTVDATGCAGVILTGDSTDPFSPNAVKSSMGSVFAVPLVIEPDFEEIRGWATEHHIQLVGASGSVTKTHQQITWNRPLGIVLGNEGDGLPRRIIDELDTTVRIPMTGTAESLNLSIAAGVLMYEVQRDRLV